MNLGRQLRVVVVEAESLDPLDDHPHEGQPGADHDKDPQIPDQSDGSGKWSALNAGQIPARHPLVAAAQDSAWMARQ